MLYVLPILYYAVKTEVQKSKNINFFLTLIKIYTVAYLIIFVNTEDLNLFVLHFQKRFWYFFLLNK
jgi:hypothetical protein